ncbi:hypothetical protein JXC34_01560 [Candidatus Woesearchaeota archaeon]|nr:hypothetical protein [Candidatus Woesearchaeota archaeon]
MEYEDPDPEHQVYLEEILEMNDFNNLHNLLPGGFRDASPTYRRLRKTMLNVVDAFIEETGFDTGYYWSEFKKEWGNHRKNSQIYLAPLYIHLREQGYSKGEIVR